MSRLLLQAAPGLDTCVVEYLVSVAQSIVAGADDAWDVNEAAEELSEMVAGSLDGSGYAGSPQQVRSPTWGRGV